MFSMLEVSLVLICLLRSSTAISISMKTENVTELFNETVTLFSSSAIETASDQNVSKPSPLNSVFKSRVVGVFVNDTDLALNLHALYAALSVGVGEVNQRYSRLSIDLVVRTSQTSCAYHTAGAIAAEEYYLHGVQAFFGPACSLALNSVARMSSYWNVPAFTAGGASTEFSDKSVYSTLTRLAFSMDKVSHFIATVLSEFDWHHVAILIEDDGAWNSPMETSLRKGFKRYEMDTGYSIEHATHVIERKFNTSFDYRDPLLRASHVSRVFIIIASGHIVRDLLLEAYDLGMGDGQYAFLAVELIKSKTNYNDFSWFRQKSPRNREARQMFESLLIVAVRVPVGPRYQEFIYDVIKNSQQKYNASVTVKDINPIIGAFYDAVLMYAWALNKTIGAGEDPKNGRAIVSRLWNRTFTEAEEMSTQGKGLTGNIFINENGDREADYTLNDLDPVSGQMQPVATYYGIRRVYEKDFTIKIHWPTPNGEPPRDIPYCGFTGNDPLCQPKEPLSILVISLGITAIALLLGVLVVFLICRKVKLEAELADHWWKIKWTDIDFSQKHSLKSMISITPSENSRVTDKSRMDSRPSSAMTVALISGVQIGMYRGSRVAVKKLDVTKLLVTREVLLELKLMRTITHDNLTRFVGLCTDEDNIALVIELSSRGSLRDMLLNENTTMDSMFKYSIMTDIVEGMTFLHSSPIEYHGHLKSTNCVIDGRFVVKITDYGLREVRKQVNIAEDVNPRDLFWTSPEHLRESDPFNTGSKKGDIYSFGVILQEIVTRQEPFEAMDRLGREKVVMGPDEILDRIRIGTIPPFRPQIAADECSSGLLDLIKQCWDENPAVRPDFPQIKTRLKKITKGISSQNFLDNILSRMEKYANNLEQLVEEKTQSLVEEKKKTEEILYQLLPKFIAEELKKGRNVRPEAFDSVTIFFSDIVGFTSLSAQSTPLDVVNLLNDLYSTFDAIIESYMVYKVETIGDAYMVASGLPVRNGNEHAREIARMALKLRSAMNTFKIRHMPQRKLTVRIGIHSGPCVAGVVGLKMPRYCLFGDTVNTASRMESNGEPLKIHISSETKRILDTFGTFKIDLRGDIEIKGKGIMTTYWLIDEKTDFND